MNKIKLSNLDKVFWPEEGYTKKDLIEYYLKIKDVILPYLKDRPESMNRFPDGINGGHFYHKNVSDLKIPDWMQTVQVGKVKYLLCQNFETLLYMVNLGCIEINPWNSRLHNLENPDYLVIDLDPLGVRFKKVVQAALGVKKILDKLGIVGFPKTTGATGMHIYIPTGVKYSYDQVKNFGKIIAILVNKNNPKITSVERLTEKRQGCVYLDYLQNNKGQTLASPYSVRPVEGACVSAPLFWEEVNESLNPRNFTMVNMPERIAKIGDPFAPLLDHKGVDLSQILRRITF